MTRSDRPRTLAFEYIRFASRIGVYVEGLDGVEDLLTLYCAALLAVLILVRLPLFPPPEPPITRRIQQLAKPWEAVVVWGWEPMLSVLTGTVPGHTGRANAAADRDRTAEGLLPPALPHRFAGEPANAIRGCRVARARGLPDRSKQGFESFP